MKTKFIITILSISWFFDAGNQESMVKSCTDAFLSLGENKQLLR
jgi:hypothetical protein